MILIDTSVWINVFPDRSGGRARQLGDNVGFELRRAGKTVKSTIDCCIAQLALENKAELLHCDRDFEIIASIRPLQHRYFDLDKSSQ